MEAPPVRYIKTSDGYDIAYTVSGAGTPVVLVAPPLSHAQLHWMSPESYLNPWLAGLSQRFQLVQYDGRGLGMSSRGLTAEYTTGTFDSDLAAVVDHLKLRSFVLLGEHYAAHAAVRYAVANPARVRALVLGPCGVAGSLWPVISSFDLAAQNWEFFLTYFMAYASAPRDSELPMKHGNAIELARQSVAQGDWTILARAWSASNVEAILPLIKTSTLVFHPRDYLNVPPAESTRLASLIAHARMTLIDGDTSMGDAESGIRAIEDFLSSLPCEHGALAQSPGARPPERAGRLEFVADLSVRELEVLRLIVAGRSSREIGEDLVLSVRTVERHIANIYLKTDTHGRAQVTAYALQRGLS